MNTPIFIPVVRLVQTEIQKEGGHVTIREMLDDAKRFGDQLGAYDFYRARPGLIPADWVGKKVYFLDKEPILAGYRCVRYVYCYSGGCSWGCDRINFGRAGSTDFVAVLASSS